MTSSPISAACGCGHTMLATKRKGIVFSERAPWPGVSLPRPGPVARPVPRFRSTKHERSGASIGPELISWGVTKVHRRVGAPRAPTRFGLSRRGQSLVEASLTLPVVLLLALGVTDLGRAFYYREAVTNSVRQSLRIAVSRYQQTTANTICSGTGSGPLAVTVTSPIPPAGGAIATIANQAALES